MCGKGVAIVVPLGLVPEAMESCQLSEDKRVWLYGLLPIHEDEMRYKLEHGYEALFDKMHERKLSELIDPKRRSVLAKRFWIV